MKLVGKLTLGVLAAIGLVDVILALYEAFADTWDV